MMIAMRRTKPPNPPPALSLDTTLFKPGLRLAVGLSGGADSVALLRALAEQSTELGLVLHVAHLHHGLRGAEADGDLEFARDLAAQLSLPFHSSKVNIKAAAKANSASGKAGESIEEAARRLRYDWFRQLMAMGEVDAVATAHTSNDQAETVLGKFLRGAWTEGLSGIYPVVEFGEGRILRPLLGATRFEVEAYLKGLGQRWREDSSNAELIYTRNRLRHELLPLLEGWNPQLREHLAQMAVLARDEEAYWQSQLNWLAPQLILPGTPVRGGGRAGGNGLALDVSKLAAQPAALQRRLLRLAAERLVAAPDFASTEALRLLALHGRAGQRCELAQGLRAERTHRELQLTVGPVENAEKGTAEPVSEHRVSIPGEVEGFGHRLRIETASSALTDQNEHLTPEKSALLRNWKPGDRVHLRYSSGPRKVKEVLERLKITGSGRTLWPVLEVEGRIVWMQDVELEPKSGLTVVCTKIEGADE
jgi:tRNA(Ile)-lysidine synthase